MNILLVEKESKKNVNIFSVEKDWKKWLVFY